ncbi:hypothetical protein DSL72_006834 [Monilinia vaccinii-corymbosi]|uniref:Uncharacterized protein n=1 Tax=Monilinia vaccinii-corymbosi TaxID=61207 RepID=A0A8A3PK36_9HELO|nr:hypothetical protein DSL72_006834 [Monilinia vaccinii-corymbosi]
MSPAAPVKALSAVVLQHRGRECRATIKLVPRVEKFNAQQKIGCICGISDRTMDWVQCKKSSEGGYFATTDETAGKTIELRESEQERGDFEREARGLKSNQKQLEQQSPEYLLAQSDKEIMKLRNELKERKDLSRFTKLGITSHEVFSEDTIERVGDIFDMVEQLSCKNDPVVMLPRLNQYQELYNIMIGDETNEVSVVSSCIQPAVYVYNKERLIDEAKTSVLSPASRNFLRHSGRLMSGFAPSIKAVVMIRKPDGLSEGLQERNQISAV